MREEENDYVILKVMKTSEEYKKRFE